MRGPSSAIAKWPIAGHRAGPPAGLARAPCAMPNGKRTNWRPRIPHGGTRDTGPRGAARAPMDGSRWAAVGHALAAATIDTRRVRFPDGRAGGRAWPGLAWPGQAMRCCCWLWRGAGAGAGGDVRTTTAAAAAAALRALGRRWPALAGTKVLALTGTGNWHWQLATGN